MPYKNKADRKKQKNPPVGSAEHERRMERQRARRAMDRKGKDGVTVQSRKKNRSEGGALSKG